MAEFSENRHISNLINMSCKVSHIELSNVSTIKTQFNIFVVSFTSLAFCTSKIFHFIMGS